jgi:hypothetical protein
VALAAAAFAVLWAVAAALSAAFGAANGTERADGWLAARFPFCRLPFWRLGSGGAVARLRRALCCSAAARPLFYTWSALASAAAPLCAWAAARSASSAAPAVGGKAGKAGRHPSATAEDRAAASAVRLRNRLRAACALILLYGCWLFFGWATFEQGVAAYRLLPPGELLPPVLYVWLIAMALQQVATVRAPLLAGARAAFSAALTEPLWLVGGGRWLEEHADASSVRATLARESSREQRLRAQLAYRAGLEL